MYKSDEELYARLRTALGEKNAAGLPTDKLQAIHARLQWDSPDDLVTPFMERVEQSGGVAFLCHEKAQIIECVSSLVEQNAIASVSLEDTAPMRSAGLMEMFQSAGCTTSYISGDSPDTVKDTLAETDAGVTTVSAGFADCGAVLSSPGPGKARMLSELTNVHLAILRKSDIYPSMSDYTPQLAEKLAKGEVSARTIIGGPSKTADIEKTLVQGVHGPRVFAVLIVDDAHITNPA